MKTISFTNLGQSLKDVFDSVEVDHEPILITRGKKGSAILMSLKEYRSLVSFASGKGEGTIAD